MTAEPGRPLLHVVRGTPTREELAAVVAVLMAGTAGPAVPAPAGRTGRPLWAEPVLRAPLHPGPGAWLASALPR